MSVKTKFKIDYNDRNYTETAGAYRDGNYNFTDHDLLVLTNRTRNYLAKINKDYYPEIKYINNIDSRTTDLYLNVMKNGVEVNMDKIELENFINTLDNRCVIYDTDLSNVPDRYFEFLGVPKITLDFVENESELVNKQLKMEIIDREYIDRQLQLKNGFYKHRIGFDRMVWYNVYSALSDSDFLITDGFVILLNNFENIYKIPAAISNERTPVKEVLKFEGNYSYKTCDQYRPLVSLDSEPKSIDYSMEKGYFKGNRDFLMDLLKKFTGEDHSVIGNNGNKELTIEKEIYTCQIHRIQHMLNLEKDMYYLTLDPLVYLIFPEVIEVDNCFFYKTSDGIRSPEFEDDINSQIRYLKNDHFCFCIDNILYYDNLPDELCEMWNLEIKLKKNNYIFIRSTNKNFDSEWFENCIINIRMKKLPYMNFSSLKTYNSGIEFNGDVVVHGELLKTSLGNKVYYDVLENGYRFELGIFDQRMPVEKLWRNGWFLNPFARAYYLQTGKISGYFKN